MDVGTGRDEPRMIDVEEPLQQGSEPSASAQPFGEQEAMEEDRASRTAAMLAAVRAVNTAVIVASGVSLLAGIGIGILIARSR